MAKVLVIESDEGTRYLYKVAIAFQKIDVITARTSKEGFKKITKEHPDLVIFDIMTPDVAAFDLLGELRKHAKNHILPVIILSDFKDPSLAKKASVLGACDYLVKSEHSIGEIIGRVRKVLDHIEKKK